jgi:hypothetical protein
MMGRQSADQAQFFYSFNLDERVPETHLLRRIDVFVMQALADVHSEMVACYSQRFGLKPKRLAADTAYGTGKFLGWLAKEKIAPHIPVWDRSTREDGTFSRADFVFDPEKNQYACPTGKPLKQFNRAFAKPRSGRHAGGADDLPREQTGLRCVQTQSPLLPERVTSKSPKKRP